MNITRFSIQRPVGITMIVLLFVVLGVYSYFRIGVELLPTYNYPYCAVSVEYPGASVEEVEQAVVKPLEQAISSAAHLKKMIAVCRQERATLMIEFDFDANADLAAVDVSKLVNRVRRELPDDIGEPVIMRRDPSATPIMEIAVKSKYSLADIYGKADQVFKERLERAEGVSDVVVGGGRDREVAVDVHRDKLAQYRLALSRIVSRIKGENIMLPAGIIYTDKLEKDVRLVARYQTPEEIRNIYVAGPAGNEIPLSALADVEERDSRAKRFSKVNGEDAISLQVFKNSDANIVNTVTGVKKQLATLRTEYPEYQFLIVANDADYIENSLKNTLATLVEGICTTGLVLYLFLRGWRSTAAVMVAIPTSLIATFLIMYAAGFTFNMMSLMGMTLCIGILVDDAIVVLENIHRHMRLGKPPAVAAEEGRNEIGMAAVAITLCDVVVFLPIAFMTDITGQYFRQFGLTIVFATLFSLFISFTLTPMLTARLFKNGVPEPSGRLWNFMEALEAQMVCRYETMLRWSLANGKKVIAAVLVLFIAAVGLIPAGIIGAEFMPRTDENGIRISVEMPVGSTADRTYAVVEQMEQHVLTIPEVIHCLSYVGEGGGNRGRLTVQLVSKNKRERSVWQITEGIRGYVRRHVTDGSVRVYETEASVAGVATGGVDEYTPVLIYLYCADLEVLKQAAARAQTLMSKVEGVKDARHSFKEGVPEYKLTVDRERMRVFHTALSDINDAFGGAISGKKAGVLAGDSLNNGLDTDIIVRLQGSDNFKAADIQAIPVVSGNGTVFLGDVAQIQEGVGPVGITRVNKQRTIIMQAGVAGRPLKEVLSDIDKTFKEEKLPEGVTYQFSGQATAMANGYRQLGQALVLSLLLVYLLLAVLYESAFTPVIRMFSLPLGLIGSLLFLLLTNNTINLYSLIGILVMDGLVAKNGTLLLDYTLTLMDRGLNAYDALIEAGKTRLKPIFMTTLTMVVGMLPTALSLTEGAEIRVSMAWVLIGGLITSTFFTLIVIPIVFLYHKNR
ncbi:MAG TPA: efflux RND transporter permease subunit [Methylomusa anaerophila]|uniref:Swarming motility protein SwrC n=1 Tax=Methylomusa anaerophila TaxID=1930071 RepID=A0A348AEA4_9FIRM|nr:efflux RND transporter permease subunit [Methylomusa anaerophila]BBB89402.1 swarming motility protein SwrC [Methylomusa anaerophila]HML90479.1 efflux RND transporter permease subunit [Methylomusa anaerophila]